MVVFLCGVGFIFLVGGFLFGLGFFWGGREGWVFVHFKQKLIFFFSFSSDAGLKHRYSHLI